MTDTRELLAMVTAHGVDVGKPFGGAPALTGLDVAGAMGMGLDRLAAELLLVKYALDETLLGSLRVSWFMVVMERKRAECWKSDSPGRFKNLADVTLAEFLSANLCPRCGGRGEIMPLKKPQTCPLCDGARKRYPSDRAMARGVGISHEGYRRYWVDRVQWCRDELERRERVGVARLKCALQG